MASYILIRGFPYKVHEGKWTSHVSLAHCWRIHYNEATDRMPDHSSSVKKQARLIPLLCNEIIFRYETLCPLLLKELFSSVDLLQILHFHFVIRKILNFPFSMISNFGKNRRKGLIKILVVEKSCRWSYPFTWLCFTSKLWKCKGCSLRIGNQLINRNRGWSKSLQTSFTKYRNSFCNLWRWSLSLTEPHGIMEAAWEAQGSFVY